MIIRTTARRAVKRSGMSLLEVTIGSMMVAVVTMMAAGVAVDMTRGMAENIARTRIATEARLVIESFRRDFAGTDPDQIAGDRSRWRLVGRMIPAADELRLCFDNELTGSADWIAPDRVVIYTVDDGQLLRTDVQRGQTIVIANHVDQINFEVTGADIEITVDFELGNFDQTYVYNTRDI